MPGCDEQILSAYLDGELASAERARVGRHLMSCAECSRKLDQLRENSMLLRQVLLPQLNRSELQDLHEAIEAAADRPVWRIGGSLGLIAASILVIGLTWLNVLPARPVVSGPAKAPLASAPLQDWERVAMTLRANPLIERGDPLDVRYASASPRYDAQLADEMIEQLDSGGR